MDSTSSLSPQDPTALSIKIEEQLVHPLMAAGRKRLSSTAPSETTSSETKPVKQRKVESGSSISPSSATPWCPEWKELATDTFYIENDHDFNGLVELCMTEHPETPIYLIRHPSDLDEHGLTRNIIFPDKPRDAVSVTALDDDGPIYNPNTSAILLIDSRAMSAANLVELNELLEKPSRYRGRPLSPNCKRLVLVNQEMQHEKGKKNSGKVHGDFWRRVSTPSNTWKAPEPSQKIDVCQLDMATSEDLSHASACTLDFQSEPDWRTVLFGSPVLDRNGKIHYQHSALKEIASTPAISGEGRVILKGAPWDDPHFRLALRQLLTSGSYTANGSRFDISQLVFVRQDRDPEQNIKLKRGVDWVTKPSPDMFYLNQNNFEQCLGETAVDTGLATHHNMLADILSSYQGLHISSPLNQAQWVRLLKKIKASGLQTKIFISEPNTQPPEFRTVQSPIEYEMKSTAVHLYCDKLLQQDVSRLEQKLETQYQQPVLTLSLTPDLDLSAITGTLSVNSLKKRQFTVNNSAFLKALRSGQPVIIRNLHKNPRLQQQLETLLQSPPCLIIHGRRHIFTKACIHVVLPEDRKPKSPIWNALVPPSRNLTFNPLQVLPHCQLPGTETVRCRQVEAFLTEMQTIPPSSCKLWPFPHPEYSPEVLKKIICEALSLKELMQSDRLTQEHWRRAVEVAVLDDYRENTEVFSFLMHLLDRHFPAEPNSLPASRWVDTNGLEKFLMTHNYQLDRDLVKAHFWELSRNLSHSCLPEDRQYRLNEYPDKHMKVLCAALGGACPERHRAELVKKLGIEPELPEVRRYRHLESLLRVSQNASRWHHRLNNTNDAMSVEDPAQIYDDNKSFAMGQQLANELQQKKVSPDETTTGFSSKNRSSHSQPLRHPAHAGIEWKNWQAARYQKITDALHTHRLVFLKGEAGTGKSHSATTVARTLSPDQEPFTVSVGPQSDQEKLLCGQQSVSFVELTPALKNTLISKGLTNDDWHTLQGLATKTVGTVLSLTEQNRVYLEKLLGTDRYRKVMQILAPLCDLQTVRVDGTILRWAKTQPINGQPIVLIIDEANLANPALWDVLQGLKSNPPYICYGGEVIYLTNQHRVIMTGNLETAPGRKFGIDLRNQAVTLLLDPMPEAFLQESILGIRLARLDTLSNDQSQQVETEIMSLWKQYRVLLKDHEFTPRDMHEICDRIEMSLNSTSTILTDHALKNLVWHTMKDVLAGELPEGNTDLDSLITWFFTQGENCESDDNDNTFYSSNDQDFDRFYTSLPNSGDFSFKGKSTESLTRHYWQSLRKIDHEVKSSCVMEGKHALLIQGPPGRGKDELFNRVHAHFSAQRGVAVDKQPLHLNASCSNWEEIRMAIRTAAQTGRIIVISELNRIPSHYLEEDLNDLLTGQSTPGFYLIATVNPGDYAGREPLSPALSSRFVLQQIGEYSDTELNTIAMHALPENRAVANAIVRKHCNLRDLANRPDNSGIPPRTSDLLSVLNCIAQQPNLSPEQIDSLCIRQYHPLLKMAEVQWIDLSPADDELSMDFSSLSLSAQPVMTVEEGRKSVLQAIYQSFPGNRPVYVSHGTPEGYDPKTGQLCIDLPLNNPGAVQRANLVMVKGLWIAHQVPTHFPLRHEKLPSALMTLWQRAFACKHLLHKKSDKNMQAAIEAFFPLDASQQKCLSLPENTEVIQRIEQLLQAHIHEPSPVLFRRFIRTLYATTGVSSQNSSLLAPNSITTDFQRMSLNQAKQNSGNSLPLQIHGSNQLVSVKGRLSSKGTGSTFTVETVLKNQPSDKHREKIQTLQVNAGRTINLKENPVGTLGYNVVEPLPLDDHTVLEACQVQGIQKIFLGDGLCHTLTGLIESPQAFLTHLSVTPKCAVEVFMDRATGLYLIRSVQPDYQGPYTVEFVLEPESPSLDFNNLESTSADVSSCDPMILETINQHSDPVIAALRIKLTEANTIQDKIKLITMFCKSMKANDSLNELDGKALCSQLLATKAGSGRQRKLAFCILASWCGIPVRIATSLSGSGSVEVSENEGVTWSPILLGGEVDNPNYAKDKKPDFPDHQQNEPLSSDDLMSDVAYSAEGVARALTTIKRGDEYYDMVESEIPDWIPQHISLSGPVSVDLVKQWLEDYCSDADYEFERVKTLAELLEKLHKEARTSNSEELMGISNYLTNYIIFEKKWVPAAHLVNPIHRMYIQTGIGVITLESSKQQMHRYYSKVLTQELVRGKDILCESPCATGYGKLDPVAASAITTLLQNVTSTRLHQILLGELPGVQYKCTPSGSVDAQRLIRQLPAFKFNQPVPALRPALVTVPVVLRPTIQKIITTSIKDPDIKNSYARGPDRKEYKSQLVADFLAKYVEAAFLQHLYQLGAGDTDSLRVLYPSVKAVTCTKPEYSYDPIKAGWIKPENFNEFYQMATAYSKSRVPCDSSLLRETWTANGFNEANLSLIEDDAQQQSLRNWLETIDWFALIQAIEDQPAWKEYLENKTRASSIGRYASPAATLVDDIRRPESPL